MDRNYEEKLKVSQQAQCGQQAQTNPGATRSDYYDNTTEREMLIREKLFSRLRSADNESSSINKALRILEAHPEFEDFIWLMRSGLV
jgi:hypothetical protein